MKMSKCDRCGQDVHKQEMHGYSDGTTEEPIKICNDCINQQMIEMLNIQLL